MYAKKMTVKPLKKKGLTKTQTNALARHSRHHSKKHMEQMKKDMLRGLNFNDAHKIAMKKVGK